tara:strand:+ start:89 stop:874 length:786 start_codon:yes stop_codon:yes gene_type:complete
MLKTRLIPVVLLKNGSIVKSKSFDFYQSTGNPIEEIERFNQWKVDELIYLNISSDKNFTFRADTNLESKINYLDLIKRINQKCFMPLTWGGGIRSADEASKILLNGADKVSLNTLVLENPAEVEILRKKFGSQAIVASVDLKKSLDNNYTVFSNNGKKNTGIKIEEWIKLVEQLNVGELLIQSIDKDGTGTGYDIDLLKKIKKITNLRIVILGGVGSYHHFIDAAKHGASGLAAANIWHYKELVDLQAKKILKESGINVRN